MYVIVLYEVRIDSPPLQQILMVKQGTVLQITGGLCDVPEHVFC
jgi:hypothetical protein